MKGRLILSTIIALAVVALSSIAALAQTAVDRRTYLPGGQGDYPFSHPVFAYLWSRVDLPYKNQKIERAWFYGPGTNSIGLFEQFNNDATGTPGQRRVQYFDKSRMEINNPNADCSELFKYVTNGLLAVELISGQMQIGTYSYVKGNDACISMAGDANDTLAPTYFAFRGVSNTRAGTHPALDRTGQRPTDTINRAGTRGTDPSKGVLVGTEFVHYENTHNIPRVFWDFLQQKGIVYTNAAEDQTEEQKLVDPWYYVSGLPISEPYWAKATIRGQSRDVLIQAFERVIFTFTPSNNPGWQVEMGNIGQHYFNWRYSTYGLCPGATPVKAQTPVAAPVMLTSTCVPNPTPSAPRPSATPTLTPTRGTVGPTRTFTPTPIRTNTPIAGPSTSTPTVRPPTLTPVPPTLTEVPPPTQPPVLTREPTRTFTPIPPVPTDTFTRSPSTNTSTPVKTKTRTPTHP